MPVKDKDNKNHPNVKARIMPHNFEAEQAVLGSALIDEYAVAEIVSDCSTEDFYNGAHREIFAAIQSIYSRNNPVDIITLVQELEALGLMESVGGISYLTSLTNIISSASNYKHYTQIVRKNSVLRKLIRAGQNIIDKAYIGDIEENVLGFAENEVFSLSKDQDKSYLKPVSGPITEAIKQIEKISLDPKANRGVPTGFTRLNEMLNGFQPGDLIIIGARPSQGKTSIGMNFIQYAALNGERFSETGKPNPYKCAVFSLEMPEISLAKRLLCSVAKVSMSHANSGKLTAEEWRRLMEAKSKLSNAHIYIDDSGINTPIDILSKCRRLKRENGLDLIMIDYLGLMKSNGRFENRQQEISEISRLMKIAAKELNVPILLLSQLSREVEKRTVKVPQMSDLRESGAIEQDADVIIFIYRPFDPNDNTIDEAKRNKVELIISKHRNGETGKVEVVWRPDYVSFEDLPNQISNLAQNIPPSLNEGEFSDASQIFNNLSIKEIIDSDEGDNGDLDF